MDWDSIRHVPADAFTWLGTVSVSRDDLEKIEFLKERKRDFEAQETGGTTSMQRFPMYTL